MKYATHLALCAVLIFFSLPCLANAQGLFQGFSGLLEFNYSFFSSKATERSGVTTKSSTNAYNPRCTLSVNTDIFPKLNLNAGGVFETTISLSSIGQENIRTTVTRMRPYIYLTLKDPFYEASIGYNRKEDIFKTAGSSGLTLINDDYLAVLKWRPAGLPYVEAQLERTNTYDDKRQVQDMTKDFISLLSRYNYRGLDIRYQGSYSHTNNKAVNVDTQDMIQSAWLNYSDSFFNRRVSLSTSYNINYEHIKTSASTSGGGGTVSVQLFPLSGLWIDPPNNTLTPLTLNVNPALIDGNLVTSAGINIGLPPQPPVPPANFTRQMGLDLSLSTQVSQLLLWVDQDLSGNPSIVDFFRQNIRVYVSSDNLNWIPSPVIPTITFGPFERRFEINFFPNVPATRYVKVVTPPLNATVPNAGLFPNISVTELQAFLRQPVAGTSGEKEFTTTRTTQNYYFDAKTRILNIPTLFYELDFFYTSIDPDGLMRYTVSNALSVNHTFSQVFSGRARVAREDGMELKERRSAWFYDAALEATPLRTLTNRLVFSGRDETMGGMHNNNNSIILYNIAELYRGLEMQLNLGHNISKDPSGMTTNETDIEILATIIPHPTLNLTLDYKYSIINRSGGDNTIPSGNMQTGQFILSYRPFTTLYFVATIDLSTSPNQKTLVQQNYGFNWSPFPDGTLQFRFFYNENLATGGIKTRTINPGVRWNFSKRSYLDFSYQKILDQSKSRKLDEDFLSMQLRIFL